MKKLLLISLTCFALSANAQTNLFHRSKFTNETLDSVKNYIAGILGSAYTLTGMDKIITTDERRDCTFSFTDYSTQHTIDVLVKKTFKGGDADAGKPGTMLIDDVFVYGYFPDLLKIYDQTFSVNPDPEQLKTKRNAMALIRKDVTISFGDEGGNMGWTIRVFHTY